MTRRKPHKPRTVAYPGVRGTRREDIKFIQKERYAEGISLEMLDFIRSKCKEIDKDAQEAAQA